MAGLKLDNINDIFNALKENNKKCEEILYKIIEKESAKLPFAGGQTFDGDLIPLPLDIARLVKDLTFVGTTDKDKKTTFQQKFPDVPSQALYDAAHSYKAIKILSGILDKKIDLPEKIQEYSDALHSKTINEALASNPERHVVRFLKTAAYILANIMTLGFVHAITKGAPLQSPQQRFFKDSVKQLKSTENTSEKTPTPGKK